MENVFGFFRKITEIAVSIGAFSFIFYFIGFVYYSSYFRAIGIEKTFLDFSYQEYVVKGVLITLFIFLLFFAVWMELYPIFRSIKVEKEKLLLLTKEIQLLEGAGQIDKQIELELKKARVDLEQTEAKLKETELDFDSLSLSKILKDGWKFRFFWLILGVSTILLYYYKQFAIAGGIFQSFIAILIPAIAVDEVKSVIREKKRIFSPKLFSIMFITIFFFPLLSGYLDGVAKDKENNFTRLNIETRSGTFENIRLVNISKGIYIFRSGEKNFFIPQSEILSMQGGNDVLK